MRMEALPLMALAAATVVVALAWRNRAAGRRALGPPHALPDGRLLVAAPVAAPLGMWLRLEVPSNLTARELRQRRGYEEVRAALRRLRAVAALGTVQAHEGRARLLVRPHERSGDAAHRAQERAVELVHAYERARAALDGEGSPAGAPIAVRATGGS